MYYYAISHYVIGDLKFSTSSFILFCIVLLPSFRAHCTSLTKWLTW